MNDAEQRPARRRSRCAAVLLAVSGPALVGCTPTVQVKAPEEPITINLNIKLDADVRVRLEEKARQDVETKSIF